MQKEYSLLRYQHSLLSEALNCTPAKSPSSASSSVSTSLGWKVLIFDSPNQQTLSSQFKVKDLRERSVTLYMNINEKRQQLYGVTALYLLQPTNQNITLLLRDFCDDLYSSVRIHFSSEPSAHALSSLAKGVAEKCPKQLAKIQAVTYSFLGYQAVEDAVALASSETELANLLCQFKQPPFLIYNKQQETFARSVKQKLDSFQAPHIFPNQGNSSSNSNDSYYTCVLIVNRQADLTPVLHHGITYSSLMADVFEMLSYNKVRLSSKKEDVYEFDSKDEVWRDKKHDMINEFQLDKQVSRINTRLSTLKENMDEYGELSEKNKRLDWHLTRANELIKIGAERQLNNYSMVEADLLALKKLSKENKRVMMELLGSAGNKQDKLRLLLIYILSCDDLSSLAELEALVDSAQRCDIYRQLKQKRLKELSQKDSSNKFIKSLAKGLLSGLISSDKKFLVTSLAEQVIKSSSANLTDLANSLGLESLPCRRTGGTSSKLRRLLIYVRGGICFNELQNLASVVGGVYYTGDKLITGSKLLSP